MVLGLILINMVLGSTLAWSILSSTRIKHKNKAHEEKVDMFLNDFKPLMEAYDNLSLEKRKEFWGSSTNTMNGLLNDCTCTNRIFSPFQPGVCSGTRCSMIDQKDIED